MTRRLRLEVELTPRQLITAIIVLGLVVAAFTAGYTIALAPTFQTVVGPGSQTSTATYIVSTDGSNSFLRDGKSGAIVSSGSSAYAVIQYGINQMCSLGKGTELIKAGAYSISHYLYFNCNGITLAGEGNGTHLTFQATTLGFAVNGSAGTTIRDMWASNTAGSTPGVQGVTGSPTYLTVSGMYLNSWYDTIIFGGSPCAHNVIRGNFIQNVTDAAIEITECQDVTVTGNVVYNAGELGVELHGVSSFSQDITITGNTFSATGGTSQWGVWSYQSVRRVTITGNVFRNFHYGVHIQATSSPAYHTEGLLINDNVFDTMAVSGVLFTTAGWRSVAIEGNLFANVSGTAIAVNYQGSNLTISGNLISRTIGAGADGIYIAPSVAGAVILGNQLSTIGRYGIYLEAQNSLVSSNSIQSTGSYAMEITAGNQTITSNSFLGWAGSGSRAVVIAGNVWYVLILGNRFYDSGSGTGVFSSTGSDYTTLAYNNFQGTGTQYSLQGSHNTIVGNS